MNILPTAVSHTDAADPFFVVGALRSGTTMLRLMLTAHPEFSAVHEFEESVSQLHDAGWPEVKAYHQFLTQNRAFNMNPLRVDTTLSYPELIRSLFRQRHFVERGGHVTAKERFHGDVIHSNFHRCPEIWPNARYIHLIRDPRDVARSCVNMGWFGNAFHAASVWLEAERRWDALCSIVPESRRLEVRYEELVREPQAQLARICEFLGAEYDVHMLDYPEESTYSQPDPSLIQQWHHKLSRRAVKLVEHACGDQLTQRGYAPSGYGSHHPGPMERVELALEHRAKRALFFINRYGLPLWVKVRVSRVAPRSYRTRVRAELQRRQNQWLK